MKDNLIVHYISRDKFTTGYINFMQLVMTEYEHCFITTAKGFELHPVKDAWLIYIEHNRALLFSKEIRDILKECQMFIMSGCGNAQWAAFLPKSIQEKSYFHFWGGDFYGLRAPIVHDGRPHPKYAVSRKLKKIAFQNAGALIFLINGEYEKFVEITGIENRNFVAPMPGDPENAVRYADYVATDHIKTLPAGTIRISVGHSATRECCHIEAFEKLEKFKAEPIEIICPLSYGDERYRRQVIEHGKKFFGDKFHPITEFMSKENYVKLISTCDIGISNSDRQHGMGYLSILLGTGAKVYMRSDTSMWNQYDRYGFYFYDTADIETQSFQEFCKFDTDQRKKNITVQDNRLKTAVDKTKEKWDVILAFRGVQNIAPKHDIS